MTDPLVLLTDLVCDEQPPWHEARLWFSDWAPRR
jgi:hypothetical protein